MKTIAVCLAAGLLFLSTFSGLYQPMKANCCAGVTHHGVCGHSTKDCCNTGVCGVMFSCNACGFLVVNPISVLPDTIFITERPVAPYIMGDSLYHSDSGWHPPQV